MGAEPVSTIERYDKTEKRKKLIPCPKVVREYNAHMGGVDLMDSYLGRYRIRMKSRKWYMRLFHHLLDLMAINSWVLYKQVHTKKGIDAKEIMCLADFEPNLQILSANIKPTFNPQEVGQEVATTVALQRNQFQNAGMSYRLCHQETSYMMVLITSKLDRTIVCGV